MLRFHFCSKILLFFFSLSTQSVLKAQLDLNKVSLFATLSLTALNVPFHHYEIGALILEGQYL